MDTEQRQRKVLPSLSRVDALLLDRVNTSEKNMNKVAYLVNLDGSLVTPEDAQRFSEICKGCCFLDTLENAEDNQNVLILHADEVYVINSNRTIIASDLAIEAMDSAERLGKTHYHYA